MRIEVPSETRLIDSFDGTKIRIHEFEGAGPSVMLCPGLGTPALSWKRVIEKFSNRFRFYSWDSRGCYGSETPADLEAMTVQDHARDMEAVVRSFGIRQFSVAGWSMGVGIALEYAHRHLDEIKSLVLINGAYSHVLKTAFAPIPANEHVVSFLVRAAKITAPVSGPIFSWLLAQPWAIDVLKGAGIVSAGADFFGAVVQEFKSMRWPVYFHMMLKYHEHDASDYLPGLNVPALITAGTKDIMTPVAVAAQMALAMPDAELFVVPDGTHYTILEYPDTINAKLEKFLRRVYPEAF